MRALARLVTAALAAALLLPWAPALDAAESWAAVGIQIREGRRPAPGVELRLRPEGVAAAEPAVVASGVTDEQGRAVVYVQPGVWRLELLSDDEVAYFVTLRVAPGRRAEELGSPARDVDAPDFRWRYFEVDEPPPVAVRAPRMPAPVRPAEPPPRQEREPARAPEATPEAPPAADAPARPPADEAPADEAPADAERRPAEGDPGDASPSDSSPFDTIPQQPSPYDPEPPPAEPEEAEEPPPAFAEPPRPSAAAPPPQVAPEPADEAEPVEGQPAAAPPAEAPRRAASDPVRTPAEPTAPAEGAAPVVRTPPPTPPATPTAEPPVDREPVPPPAQAAPDAPVDREPTVAPPDAPPADAPVEREPIPAPPAPPPADAPVEREPAPAEAPQPQPPVERSPIPPPAAVPAPRAPVDRQPIPTPAPPPEPPVERRPPPAPPAEAPPVELPETTAAPGAPAPMPAPAPPAEPELPPAPPRFAAQPAGECPGCRPDEAAAVVERTVAPGGGLCGGEIAPAAVDAARRLAGRATGPQPLEGGGLAPWTGGEGCQVLGVLLPAGATYRGYRYEAEGAAGGGRCYAGDDCPVPGAAWPERPVIRPLDDGSTLVYGLFRNTSPDRARRARLTVYFRP